MFGYDTKTHKKNKMLLKICFKGITILLTKKKKKEEKTHPKDKRNKNYPTELRQQKT